MDEEFIDQHIEDLANNARTNFESRDYLGAIENSEQGLSFLREHGDKNNLDHVRHWACLFCSLTASQGRSGCYVGAIETARRGLAFLDEHGDTANSRHVGIWAALINSQASGQGSLEDYTAALESTEQGLAFLQAHGDTGIPEHIRNWALLWHSQSFGKWNLGDSQGLLYSAEQGLHFLQEHGDTNNPKHVEVWVHLFRLQAIGQQNCECWSDQVRASRRGLNFLQEHGDTESPEHVRIWARLFCSQSIGEGSSGNHEGQIQSAREGLAFLQEHGDTNNPEQVGVWAALFHSQATGEVNLGDRAGCVETAGRALCFLQEHGDTNNPEHVGICARLFRAKAANLEDAASCIETAGEGLNFLQEHGDTNNPEHIEIWAFILVSLASGQGRAGDYVSCIETAVLGLALLQDHGDSSISKHVEVWARLLAFQGFGQGRVGEWADAVETAGQGLAFLQNHGKGENPQHVEIWADLFSAKAIRHQDLGDVTRQVEVARQGLDFLSKHGKTENPEHVGIWALLFHSQATGEGNSGNSLGCVETAGRGLAFLQEHGVTDNSKHVGVWAKLFLSQSFGQQNLENVAEQVESTSQGLDFLQKNGDANNFQHVRIWARLFEAQAIGHLNSHSPEKASEALTQALNLLSKWLHNPDLYAQQWKLRLVFTKALPQVLWEGLDQLWNHIEEPEFLPSVAQSLPQIYQILLKQEVERADWHFTQNVTRIIETLSLQKQLFQRIKVLSPLFSLWQASRKENRPSPGQCLPFLEGLIKAISLAHNASDANDSETQRLVVQILYNELLVTFDSDLRQQLDLPKLEGMLAWFQQSLRHLAQDFVLVDLTELLVALFLTEEFLEEPFAPAGQFIFSSLLPALESFPAEYARLNELKTRTPKRLGGLAENDPASQETAIRHARFFGLLRSSLLVSAEQKFEEHLDSGKNRDQILLEYLETSFDLISESDVAMPNYLALLPELFRDRAWIEDVVGLGGNSEELEATELYSQLYLEDAKSLQYLLEALPDIQGLYVSMVIKDSQALFVASAGSEKTRVWTVKEPQLERKITDYVNQILDGVNRLWESSVALIERLEGESSEAAKSKFLASALNSPSKTSWFSKLLQAFSGSSGTQVATDPDETVAELFKLLKLHNLLDLAKESGSKTLMWSPFGPLHAVPPGLFGCSSEGPFFEIFDRIVVVPGAAKRVGKVAMARTQEPTLLTQPLSKDQTQDETYFSKIRQGLGFSEIQEESSGGSLTPENVRANQRAAFQVWIAHGQPSRRIHRGSRWEKTFCLGVGTDDGVIEFKEFVRELEGEENLLPPIMSFLCFQGLLAQNALTVEGFARRLLPFTEALIASPFPIQRSLLRMILESEAPNAPSLKPDSDNLGSLPVTLARRLPELALKWPSLHGGGKELATFLERGSLRAFLTSHCTVWDILKTRENAVL